MQDTVKTFFPDYENNDYSSIEKIIIQEGVKEIEDYAFLNAKAKEVFIPASVDKIGGNAFRAWRLVEFLEKAIIDDSDGTISIHSSSFPSKCKIIYKSQMGFFGKLFH